jgi:hypothetical protein
MKQSAEEKLATLLHWVASTATSVGGLFDQSPETIV